MARNSGLARVVVCDAGPLIHLDELDALSLLSDFPELLVSDAVWAEVERHRPVVFDRAEVEFQRVSPAGPVSPQLLTLSRLFPLHLGETQALQIVGEAEADLLLTDDTAARLAARQLGISVHGTLGILLRSVRRRQLRAEDVAEMLRSVPERSTLHVKPSLLQEIVKEVESVARKP